MNGLRAGLSIALLLVLGACADTHSDPVQDIAARVYVSPEPTSITLLTVVNSESDFGEHTGILINASQQVLYDPAGSFRSVNLARARDVHYGVTPYMVDYYKSYHARFGYYVVAQTIEVPPDVAEEVFRRAVDRGATPKLQCSVSASWVLHGVPMFSSMSSTLFPGKMMEEFAMLPGVVTSITRENDIGQNYVEGVNAL